tara:strand:+ start:6938 stop:7168 length:231 start_codon:yes stop_codon:yes gene_type:complete
LVTITYYPITPSPLENTMETLPTTIDSINLARSFTLHNIIKQLDEMKSIDGYSPLEISLLEELLNEIIDSITPLEE